MNCDCIFLSIYRSMLDWLIDIFLVSLPDSLPRCNGCEGIIFDRFILKLGQENDRHTCWHSGRLIQFF